MSCYHEDKITLDPKEYKEFECVTIECHLRHNLSELLSNSLMLNHFFKSNMWKK